MPYGPPPSPASQYYVHKYYRRILAAGGYADAFPSASQGLPAVTTCSFDHPYPSSLQARHETATA